MRAQTSQRDAICTKMQRGTSEVSKLSSRSSCTAVFHPGISQTRPKTRGGLGAAWTVRVFAPLLWSILTFKRQQRTSTFRKTFRIVFFFFLFDDATIVLGVCEIAEQSAGECSNVTANFIHALLVFVLVLEFTANNSGKSQSCVYQ